MEQKTIIIIVVVVLLLISSSISSYFMMSGDEKPKTPASPPAKKDELKTPGPPPPPPPAAPTVNWAGKAFSTDGRCGPEFGNKACTGKACCSKFGWCGGSTGQSDDWCGTFKGFNGEYNAEKP